MQGRLPLPGPLLQSAGIAVRMLTWAMGLVLGSLCGGRTFLFMVGPVRAAGQLVTG